jgi:hypothetical protein
MSKKKIDEVIVMSEKDFQTQMSDYLSKWLPFQIPQFHPDSCCKVF